MFSRTRGIATLALALTLPVAACDDGTDTEFGSVTIQLTDAPGEEILEAWVTITDIYLQGETGEADPAGSRVYLLEDAVETHELLSLANDVENLVVGQEVPTGTYGQLRIIISDGCILTADGSVYTSSPAFDRCGTGTGTLQMPSFEQTGAKVLLNGLQVDGGQQILLLDFNVEDSFGRAAGLSNMWVMQPVIHASDISLTAGVEVTLSAGEVELPVGFELSDFSATLDPMVGDSSRVTFVEGDTQGVYEVSFRFLLPDNGPFEVRLNSPDALVVTVDPDAAATLNLTSGETGSVDWVLQSATEAGVAAGAN